MPINNAELAHCTVLIVEDDAGLREMMVEMLSFEGFHALTAGNGREALDCLHHARPDVILLDLMMPVMDGWEFRRQQQLDPALAKVPVVVLSALDDSKARGLGGTAFFRKPPDFDSLVDVMRHYCH